MSERVWIGLGSNLADPVGQVRAALAALAELPGSSLEATSPLYGSRPMGPPGQPDYVNAVARLQTTLDPHELLDALQAIETAAGRVRDGERWGPRVLDLDILLFADRSLTTARLQVPHPGLLDRPFVLLPLADLDPDLDIPGMGLVAERAAACDRSAAWRLEDVPA